jgi:AraC family transcriptional regulator, positive regulator of tynA and feaB
MSGATPQQTWSTAMVPVPEQFAFWQEVVWEAFVPVSVTRRVEGPFRSTVTARRVGALGVAQIDSPAQAVARTSPHLRRHAGDVFFLNLPLSDGTSACQDGRTARLAKGDFVIVDSSRPFQLGFEQEFRQMSLTIPHELLAPLLAAPGDVTAIRVHGDRGVGAVASAALQALGATDRPFDCHSARSLSDRLAGLISLALGGLQAPPTLATRTLLLQAALDEVERSLGDPDLSPSHVAARIAVSTRYLHRLFADHGPSFGRWVLARRLEHCHRDLSDPSRSHWTISEIALHHGFRDPAYFSRAFKSRYGTSPREIRRSE